VSTFVAPLVGYVNVDVVAAIDCPGMTKPTATAMAKTPSNGLNFATPRPKIIFGRA
jgi:hypothetical protein